MTGRGKGAESMISEALVPNSGHITRDDGNDNPEEINCEPLLEESLLGSGRGRMREGGHRVRNMM